MSRDWTPAERDAASKAMKAAGELNCEEFKVALGLDALSRLMKEQGDTKASLAACLGTSRQNVSQIFKLTHSFTLKQVRVIAQRYEMTPEQICECFALLPD